MRCFTGFFPPLKSTLLAFLVVIGRAACSAPDYKLAYQMQAAVLESQNVAKVGVLLKQGVDINAPIGCGTYSPLDGAIDRQNPVMLKFLLAHGARPQPGNLACAAFASGAQQALEMTRALIAAGVNPNARDGDENTALLSAAYRGNVELVKFLLAQPGIKLDEFDVDGFSALMWAAKHGASGLVDMLVQAGANVHAKNPRGETAADIAEKEIQTRREIISKLKASAG